MTSKVLSSWRCWLGFFIVCVLYVAFWRGIFEPKAAKSEEIGAEFCVFKSNAPGLKLELLRALCGNALWQSTNQFVCTLTDLCFADFFSSVYRIEQPHIQAISSSTKFQKFETFCIQSWRQDFFFAWNECSIAKCTSVVYTVSTVAPLLIMMPRQLKNCRNHGSPLGSPILKV